MKNPIITRELLEWLEAVCDRAPKASDSNDVIRWKAAQRNVHTTVKNLFDSQNASHGNKAVELGFTIKSDT